jgi:hypothetical protein
MNWREETNTMSSYVLITSPFSAGESGWGDGAGAGYAFMMLANVAGRAGGGETAAAAALAR